VAVKGKRWAVGALRWNTRRITCRSFKPLRKYNMNVPVDVGDLREVQLVPGTSEVFPKIPVPAGRVREVTRRQTQARVITLRRRCREFI